MKKLFTLLCGALLCVGASAGTVYTLSLGSVITKNASLVEGTDYIMYDAAGTTSYVKTDALTTGANVLTTTTAPASTYTDETFKQYIVQVKKNSDGTYYLYFPYVGEGEYMPQVSQGGAFKTVAASDAYGYAVSDAANGVLFRVGTTSMWVNSYAKSGYLSGNSGSGAYSQWRFKAITWTEASSQTVKYNLVYDGKTVMSEDVEATAGSASSAFVPAKFSAPGTLVSLSYDVETIESTTTEVNVTATWAGPFTLASSFDDATWYWVKMNNTGTPYLYYDSSLDYLPLSASADKTAETSMWAFSGDPYNGLTIYNKAAGSDKILVSGEIADNSTFPVMGTESTYTKFYPTSTTSDGTSVTVSGGFFLSPFFYTTKYQQMNNHSNNNKLTYWTGGAGAGSTFTVEEVDYAALIVKNYSTYFEDANVGVYYGLTQEGYDALNSEYTSLSSTCTADQYKEFSEKVASYLKKPATGYYRLKNYSFKTYAGYNEYGAVASLGETAVASVVYLDVQDDESFSIQIEDKYLQAPCSNQIPLGESAAYFTADPAQPGIVRIAGVTYTDYQYVNETGASGNYAICGWYANGLSTNPGSYWYIEDATSAEVALTAVGSDYYGTVATNFPYTVSGASACTVTLNEDKDKATLTEISATVPAFTGVVLKGTGKTATLTIDATNEAAAVETATEGTFEYAESTSDYVLSVVDDEIGFYKASVALPANKAYLPESAVQSGVRGITFVNTTGISTIENAAAANGKIFDLQGRQLKQIQSGVQIVNGKKIVK